MIPSDRLQEFREALLRGSYNLLLGSGITLDSTNGRGQLLRSSEQLRGDLCSLKGAPSGTSLTRVYGLLSPQEVQDEIIERHSNCQAGPSLSSLPRFLWRRLFTFNVDDVLEDSYRVAIRKQSLRPVNFNEPMEPTPERDELLAIHLHGWVGNPAAGFVFATTEYARVMKSLNPWMHLLSEILATERFSMCLNRTRTQSPIELSFQKDGPLFNWRMSIFSRRGFECSTNLRS